MSKPVLEWIPRNCCDNKIALQRNPSSNRNMISGI